MNITPVKIPVVLNLEENIYKEQKQTLFQVTEIRNEYEESSWV
jgi:hypothetical protein